MARTLIATEPYCPRCGRERRFGETECPRCATRRTRSSRPAAYERPRARTVARAAPVAEPTIHGIPEPWFFLGLGLVVAPVFALTPLARLTGWVFSSLVHELGHTLAAWLVGSPAVPVLSFQGHAATAHFEPILWLALAIWAGLVLGARSIEPEGLRRVALGLALVGYPLLAFTGAKEVLHITGGHLAELAFGVLALHRALSGGFTHHQVERGLYGVLGWYVIGSNLWLTGGLALSASHRAWYASSGSFGLTNDYIRLAEFLGASVEAVGFSMSLVALAMPFVAVYFWSLGREVRLSAGI